MEDTSKSYIENILREQRNFFATYKTRDVNFRLENLKKFKQAILQYTDKISEALWKDLHKSPEETYTTELAMVKLELDNHIKHLKKWARPKRVTTPYYLLPASSKVIFEPLGVALIIAPWNYPFMLLMNALVGAVSSGCCVVLKPSPYTPHTAKVMEEMIKKNFASNYIDMVQGGREVNEFLLEKKFDIIFFTGSPSVGRVVMKAAAKNLTPVILELGGKSPCIVDKDANIDVAAERIVWGKMINAGQSCIAPDYIFVHKNVKDELISKLAKSIEIGYGTPIQQSRYYPRIVNEQAFDRIEKLMKHGKIVYGGKTDRADKFIEPTIIDEVQPDYPIMQEEIFGPLFPLITFEDINETITYINAHEKPLAFYYFGKRQEAKDVLAKTTSGGGCINETMLHIGNHHLMFGGTGNSGVGKYHGKESFLVFSNQRGIVTTPTWLPLPLRIMQFKYFKLLKKIV